MVRRLNDRISLKYGWPFWILSNASIGTIVSRYKKWHFISTEYDYSIVMIWYEIHILYELDYI